jgi:hypothetical protein
MNRDSLKLIWVGSNKRRFVAMDPTLRFAVFASHDPQSLLLKVVQSPAHPFSPESGDDLVIAHRAGVSGASSEVLPLCGNSNV